MSGKTLENRVLLIKMNNAISTHIQCLSQSATLAMAQRINEFKAKGIDIVNFCVGEPDFNTPEHIKRAAEKAINDNWTKYTPVPGLSTLRDAICGKLKRENGLEYQPQEILVSNGAKQSVCNAILSLVSPGNEVVIPAPYYVSYPQMVNLSGGINVFVNTTIENGFRVSPEQLEKAITPKTKLVIICTPNNPTGVVYTRKELEAMAEVILRHENVFVISDEIYEHLNYIGKHASMASVPGMRERTIVVNGVSKSYAMTGWRIGFIAAPKWIVEACNVLQGQYTGNPCSVSQKAAEEAWNGEQGSVEEMRKVFHKRRDLMVRLVREVPGLEVYEPDGAFYVFPKCNSFFCKSFNDKVIGSSSDLAMFLLEEGHVAAVSGDAFGAPGFIRLSYATSEDRIVEGLHRINKALDLLR